MPCPEFLRGSGQVLSTAAMPQTNHTRTAGPGLTTTRFADNHHIYRRLGAREPRAGRLRRGTPFGTAPQGAVAGIPPHDQQPHGADGRVRGARNAQVRGFGRGHLLRFEIRRRRRFERLGLRLGPQGIRGQEKPRSLDAFPARVQPPQRPFRLGQGPRRNSREQPLRLFGRGGGQRQGALARRHGLRSRRAVKRKAAAPFFRHKVHHNPFAFPGIYKAML